MREGLLFRVPEDLEGCRLDRYLRRMVPDVPARSLRFALESGDVLVGAETAKKGRALHGGEEVSVRRIPEERDWMPVPGDLPGSSVLHADGEVAVLSKPPDVHTEPQRPFEKGTLAGYLAWLYPEVAAIVGKPGLTLLTRLDYATSGAVPAALTAGAYAFLLREREHGRIAKTYLCLVHGVIDRRMSLRFAIDTEDGEKVRIRTGRKEPDPGYWTGVTPVRSAGNLTLVLAEISRGKRHQIRAHLAAAGFPIVGDRRYSAVPQEGPGTVRLMLHALEVRFAHPSGKGEVRAVSPPPPEFDAI